MRVKLIPGPKDEKLIALVRDTLAKCQSEEGESGIYDVQKAQWIPFRRKQGSCSGCDRCSKYGCDIMKLCRQYGHDKIYDAA